MCIVTVIDDDYVSGRGFAETLASRLRYRLVGVELLIGQAAAWGGDKGRLHRTFEQTPHFVDRFVGSKDIQVLQLRAALARDIQEGNVVCYGIAADLVNLRAKQVLRVHIKASYESRVILVQQRMKLNAVDPKVCLDNGERRRERWQKYLYGTETSVPNEPDLVINLDETAVDQACNKIRHITECLDRLRPSEADTGIIEKWALCTAIRAALAQYPKTSHLEIDVTSHGDAVVLSVIPPACDEGSFPVRFPRSIGLSIRSALAQYAATSHLNPEVTIMGDTVVLRGVPGGANEIIGRQPLLAGVGAGLSRIQANPTSHQAGFYSGQRPVEHPGWQLSRLSGARVLLRPVAAAVVAGIVALSALFYGSLSSKRKLHQPGVAFLSLTGVITDSTCGANPKRSLPSANCVRSCVHEGRAKYASREGTHLIVISNQEAVEGFAARKVMVTGRLDKKNKELHVTAVRAVAL